MRSSDGAGGYWTDVRIPLQYCVIESTLRMPAGTKANFRGFATPPPLPATPEDAQPAPPAEVEAAGSAVQSVQTCRLWVRYRIGDEIRTASVADSEPMQLGPA